MFICGLICCGCVATYFDEPYTQPDYFHSECTLRNVEYYGNYNIQPKVVEMYLIRRERVVLSVDEYPVGGSIYTMTRDTVYIDREIYHYNLEQFKDLLIKKNELPRDTTIFKITNNMYCDWKTFDQMYNKYIK